MDPRRLALVPLALVLLAGCLGGIGTTPTPDPAATATVTPTSAPPASETPETPTTRTATDRSPSTGDCPAYVSVDAVDDAPADATVIPHENLSAERKAEFETALSEGNAEVEDGGEAYSFWVDRPYVRYEGTVYRAVVAVC